MKYTYWLKEKGFTAVNVTNVISQYWQFTVRHMYSGLYNYKANIFHKAIKEVYFL